MRKAALFPIFLMLFLTSSPALAAKARSIATDQDSAYHAEHLQMHIDSAECHATGNYIKIRNKANGNQIVGHLEQADQFILFNIKDGWAQIYITYSDKTSPDSKAGMTGWINSDYIDCECNEAAYRSNGTSISNTALSYPFPEGMPSGWFHSSGAGAWSTDLEITSDGSFYGYYHDLDMGDSDESYPNGTIYESSFWGTFSHIRQVDEFTYSMTVSSLDIGGVEGSKHIEDGVLHILSHPAGIGLYHEFLLYLPGCPKEKLSEDVLSWIHGTVNDPITSFILCDAATGDGFDIGSELP